LGVAFLLSLIVDWEYNRQAFQSLSTTAIATFFFIVLLGLIASACFNPLFYDFNSQISNKPEAKQYYVITYEDQEKSKRRWSLRSPWTGFFMLLISFSIVYTLSAQRVVWQKAINSSYPNDVFIPCFIFLFSVLTGCGAHFILERTWLILKHKYYEYKLSKLENEIEEQSDKSLDVWDEYNSEMDEIENNAIQQGLPIPERIQPNRYLQALIDRRNGNSILDESDELALLPDV